VATWQDDQQKVIIFLEVFLKFPSIKEGLTPPELWAKNFELVRCSYFLHDHIIINQQRKYKAGKWIFFVELNYSKVMRHVLIYRLFDAVLKNIS
jgi:hypothetical protein